MFHILIKNIPHGKGLQGLFLWGRSVIPSYIIYNRLWLQQAENYFSYILFILLALLKVYNIELTLAQTSSGRTTQISVFDL